MGTQIATKGDDTKYETGFNFVDGHQTGNLDSFNLLGAQLKQPAKDA